MLVRKIRVDMLDRRVRAVLHGRGRAQKTDDVETHQITRRFQNPLVFQKRSTLVQSIMKTDRHSTCEKKRWDRAKDTRRYVAEPAACQNEAT